MQSAIFENARILDGSSDEGEHDRFVRVAQLFQDAAEVEFGEGVLRFVLHSRRKFAERFFHAIQLIQSGAEIDVRFNPFGRGVDGLAVCLRGLLQGFGIRVASHA